MLAPRAVSTSDNYDMSQSFAGLLSQIDRVLLDADVIQRRTVELAKEIEQDFDGRPISVVALMDGALFFVADLLRHINLPVQLHTMSVSSYHGGTATSGRVQMAQTLPFDLKAKHVLLIDDILDTGLTLSAVRERLLQECSPETLKVAVLLRKNRLREAEVHADYVGFDIEDEFVVGYGMDYQGYYRPLPSIGILNPNKEPQP